MLDPLLLCAALAVGQSAEPTPIPPALQVPPALVPAAPYPAGRTFAPVGSPSPAPASAPEAEPEQAPVVSLPTTLFPSPDQAAAGPAPQPAPAPTRRALPPAFPS